MIWFLCMFVVWTLSTSSFGIALLKEVTILVMVFCVSLFRAEVREAIPSFVPGILLLLTQPKVTVFFSFL